MAKMGIAPGNSSNGIFPKSFKNIYIKKDDVVYVFYMDSFAMVAGLLKEDTLDSAIEDFKEKYNFISHLTEPIRYESAVGLAQMVNTDNIDLWEYKSGDGALIFLIKDMGTLVMNSSATGTEQFGPNGHFGFLYIPKDKLVEIQGAISKNIETNETIGNNQKQEEKKKDESKF